MTRRRWLILLGSAAALAVASYFLSHAEPGLLGRYGIDPFDNLTD